ncbi:dihydropteroate synthase [Brachybacterium sp. AOP25-B2-12]|uniref:dihydropteroate synthase n=1 Tax=Brachybacterium sp. AOP25-B2-12 TaxID=3457710 RepID=UPI00403473F5
MRLRTGRTRRPDGLPPGLAEADGALVMGILNTTPDSFSDGGEHDDPAAAIAHGLALTAAGADLVDVGGESTRPGADRVSAREELRRVVPVIRELAAQGVAVSVDTMRAEVAAASLAAGAVIVNDVSGGLADPDMAALVATARTALGGPPVYIAMHWRGHSDVMASRTVYDDVVRDVVSELRGRIAALEEAGIDRSRLVADPGLGFAKTGAQNWDLLARWDELAALDLPLLLGASRKGFLGRLDVDRDAATGAISAHAALHGAWCVRVHAVAPSLAAVRVARRIHEREVVPDDGPGNGTGAGR